MSIVINQIKKFLRPKTYLDALEYRLLTRFKSKEKVLLSQTKKAFVNGYKDFEQTGRTSEEAYQSLIKLYCLTNGKFNEEYHDKIKSLNPPLKTGSTVQGVMGEFDRKDFEAIDQILNRDGYIRLDKKLNKETCSRLYTYALKTPVKEEYPARILYDPNNPVFEIYRLDGLDLINNQDVQSLIMDPTLINVARNYFGCEPIFDWPNMWWSTCYNTVASSEAAQLYHFDMERIKWLKIFIYVNDVTPDNGSHCYIRGSHRTDNKPMELLKRGYARIEDPELKQYYKQEDFVEVNGEAGTILVGDTKCWHKGNLLKKGHRLMLELEYTASLFGVNRSKLVVQNPSAAFKQFCNKNKIYASNISFGN